MQYYVRADVKVADKAARKALKKVIGQGIKALTKKEGASLDRNFFLQKHASA